MYVKKSERVDWMSGSGGAARDRERKVWGSVAAMITTYGSPVVMFVDYIEQSEGREKEEKKLLRTLWLVSHSHK